MLLDFDTMLVTPIEHMKGGEGTVQACMLTDANGKIMRSVLEPGVSIGMHCHDTSSEMLYVLEGKARILCDGTEEIVAAGQGHYCPKGSEHTIINDGPENLMFFAVVPEQ